VEETRLAAVAAAEAEAEAALAEKQVQELEKKQRQEQAVRNIEQIAAVAGIAALSAQSSAEAATEAATSAKASAEASAATETEMTEDVPASAADDTAAVSEREVLADETSPAESSAVADSDAPPQVLQEEENRQQRAHVRARSGPPSPGGNVRSSINTEDEAQLAESYIRDEETRVAALKASITAKEEKERVATEEKDCQAEIARAAADNVDDSKETEADVPDDPVVFTDKPTAAAPPASPASADPAKVEHEAKKDKHKLRLGDTYAKKGASLLNSKSPGRGAAHAVQRRAPPPPPGSTAIREIAPMPGDDAQKAQSAKDEKEARERAAVLISEERRKLDVVHAAEMAHITEDSHAANEGWRSSPSLEERRSTSEKLPGKYAVGSEVVAERFPALGNDSADADNEPPPYSAPEGDYSLAPTASLTEEHDEDPIPHPEVPAAGRKISLKTSLPPQSVYLRRKSVSKDAPAVPQIEAGAGVSVLNSADNSNKLYITPDSRGNRSRTSSLDMPTGSPSSAGRGRSRSGSGGSPIVDSAPKNQALLEAQALMINQKRRESFVGEAQLAAQATVAATQQEAEFARTDSVAIPTASGTVTRSRGGSELGLAAHGPDHPGSPPQQALSSLAQSPKGLGIADNIHSVIDNTYLATAEIESRETERLLELQRALSEREKHDQELQRAEAEEKRQRELRKEEMLKQRELRRTTSGAGAGLMGSSGLLAPSSLTISTSSAGSLPHAGMQTPPRANPDFKHDIMHVEVEIGVPGFPVEHSSASDVLDAADLDSGDEEEQRERERLVKAEQERLAAIESLKEVLPTPRRERLLSISKGATLDTGSAGSSSTGLRDMLTRSASVAEEAEAEAEAEADAAQQDAERVIERDEDHVGEAADTDGHVGAPFVI